MSASPPSLSVIVRTRGQASLAGVTAGVVAQLGPADELILVAAGPLPAACGLAASLADPRARYFEHADSAGRPGFPQWSYGADRARGDRLLFLGDDLELCGGALARVRREAAEPRPVVFRATGEGAWGDPGVRPVDDARLVLPNTPGRRPGWPGGTGDGPAGFEWVTRSLDPWPVGEVTWSRTVICQTGAGGRGGALTVPPRIPRVVHQLWIGPAPGPWGLMAAWRDMYTGLGWGYRLWTEAELAAEPFRLRPLVDAVPEVNGRADLYRWEILHRYGGLFVDADSAPQAAVPDDFLQAEFFSCYENEVARPGLVGCGAMGATPGNAVTARIIARLESGGPAEVTRGAAWETVGPGLLTDVLGEAAGYPATVFPARHFIPDHYTGVPAPGEGPVYARQLWGSTHKTYDRLAVDYPPPDRGSRWDVVYAPPAEPRPYGPLASYRLAAQFLGDCAKVEDWGCGWAWFRRYLPDTVRYRGVDGSRGARADVARDLRLYRASAPAEGVLLRHVLDHNPDWAVILENALASFSRKLCLVFFAPLRAGDRAVSLGHDPATGVDDLSLPRAGVEGLLDRSGGDWWSVVLQTGCPPYTTEEMYFVTRPPQLGGVPERAPPTPESAQ
jgi:hypothetical protein